MGCKVLLLVSLTVAVGWGQPREIELWGAAGPARAAGDEGSIGTGVAYGIGGTFPLTRRLAFEADVLRMRAERFEPGVTRVLVSPAGVWRFGAERMYGFVGGGPGIQVDRGRALRFDFRPGQQQPSVTETSYTTRALPCTDAAVWW